MPASETARHGPRLLLAAAALVALLMAACGPAAPAEVTYTVQDSGFAGPDSLAAGWTKVSLTNASQAVEHVQFFKLDGGHTVDDLAAALTADPERFPDWSHPLGGPNAPDSGGTSNAFVNFEPGSYALLSFIPNAEGVPGMARGFLKAVTVTADRSTAAEPKSDVTVDLADFNFSVSGDLTAGTHTFRFNNVGGQPHEGVLVKLNEGVLTAADYLNAAPDGPPAAVGVGGITAIAVGDHQYITTELSPGNYALFCFFTDAETHAPHFVLGMMTEFTVP
jgi:hypothetical protein